MLCKFFPALIVKMHSNAGRMMALRVPKPLSRLLEIGSNSVQPPHGPLCISRVDHDQFLTQITSPFPLFFGNSAQEKRCRITMQVKENESAISGYVLAAQRAKQ